MRGNDGVRTARCVGGTASISKGRHTMQKKERDPFVVLEEQKAKDRHLMELWQDLRKLEGREGINENQLRELVQEHAAEDGEYLRKHEFDNCYEWLRVVPELYGYTLAVNVGPTALRYYIECMIEEGWPQLKTDEAHPATISLLGQEVSCHCNRKEEPPLSRDGWWGDEDSVSNS